MRTREDGFTMIEMLTAFALLSIVSVSFFGVLLSTQRSSRSSRSSTVVSEETRLGFNRMVRDTREAQEIVAAAPDAFTARVDFENDNLGPQLLEFKRSGSTILLNEEVLMRGVACIPGAGGGGCAQDVFTFSSNRLEYDWDSNGVTTWQELDQSASPAHGVVGVGNNDGELNVELSYVTDVMFAVQVSNGSSTSRMIAQTQLRNNR